jgi:hypothetical protein
MVLVVFLLIPNKTENIAVSFISLFLIYETYRVLKILFLIVDHNVTLPLWGVRIAEHGEITWAGLFLIPLYPAVHFLVLGSSLFLAFFLQRRAIAKVDR